MPAITFDRFDAGLDLSKSPSTEGANQLRKLTNAYVTTARSLRKRPGLRKVADLEPGTVGLVAGSGVLHTFYGQGSVSHANPLFQANLVPHPAGGKDIARIHAATVFNGYLYVVAEYDNGDVYHSYLDDPGAWAASTAYNAGDFRRPTTPNGYRYEVVTAGTSGASEPAWPTTVGATVTDGGVTWKCVAHEIRDSNCQHSKSIAKSAQKIWAVDGEVVRFTATGDPRDWTTAQDAGFLPTGLQTTAEPNAVAVGTFRQYLAVLGASWLQIWQVDPDPARHALFSQIQGIGTEWPRSVSELAGDVYFLSRLGFRSVTLSTLTGNVNDVDVGSAIDPSVREHIRSGLEPHAIYWPGAGQYICAMRDASAGTAPRTRMWVYSFSRTAKVSGWSYYELPEGIDVTDMAVLDGQLYLRAEDAVYVLDDSAYTDDGREIPVEIALPYLDFKAPGVLKQLVGIDAVVDGTAKVAVGWDAREESRQTQPVQLAGNTRPGDMMPLEICATEVSPVVTHQADEAFELYALTLYFETLGPV